jgi:hypothetical protein
MSVKSAEGWKSRRAALLGIAKFSSFHIARIDTSVLSSSASFIMMTFCKLEVVLDKVVLDLDGGPSGGNGPADIDALVGLVIADVLLLP